MASELERHLLRANEQLLQANEQLMKQLRELVAENQADRRAYRQVIEQLQRSLDGDSGDGDDSNLWQRLIERLSKLEQRLHGLEAQLSA